MAGRGAVPEPPSSGSAHATPEGNAVVVQGLHKAYGAIEAVAGVDLEIARGEVLGLLGPNGAHPP